MLFFQFTLLAGYGYTHFSCKYLTARLQVLLHLILLSTACISLPFYVDYTQAESPEGSPVFWVLALAALTAGLPFFAVSASSPMLQHWFSLTRHKHRENPYFLYAASNLGSMAALLSFPTLLEPSFGVRQQTDYWQTWYLLLVVLFLLCCIVTFGASHRQNTVPLRKRSAKDADNSHPTVFLRLSWVLLAFIPSSMMLGLTSHVTTDIAPISLFWIIPLTLYLLSFAVVFSRFRLLIPNRALAGIILLCTLALTGMKIAGFEKTINAQMLSILVHVILFFATSWLLHGFLSSTKPAASHLTEFYLWLSLGGMLGGVFNAVVAPLIFNQIYEYYVVILSIFFFAVKILLARPPTSPAQDHPPTADLAVLFGVFLVLLLLADALLSRQITDKVRHIFLACLIASFIITAILAICTNRRLRPRFALCLASLAVCCLILVLTQTHTHLLLTRSFYGALKIKLRLDKNDIPYHLLIHGSTRHNLQRFIADDLSRPEPLMYYHRQANIGHAISSIKAYLHRPLHLGLVGLGAGAVCAYLEEHDTATFFEIDPKVAAMAQNREYFTYLSTAPGTTDIILGDARLQMTKTADSSFDLLLIDAFASDAIPIHLLSQEAVTMYLKKLKDDGILIFHLSNRFLELKKVMQGYLLPEGFALYYASKIDVEKPAEAEGKPAGFVSHSQVAVIAKKSSLPQDITGPGRWHKLEHDPDFVPWTDDYSNVLGVFQFGQRELKL